MNKFQNNKFILPEEEDKLSRRIHPMPDYLAKLLQDNKLEYKYRVRPAYQKNDYVGWIARAKLEKTKKKRIAQMISELKKGNVYMGMSW